MMIAAGSAGCSSSGMAGQPSPAISVTGPWANEFTSAYASATSDYERGVLHDGAVTAAEYEQTKTHLRSCLDDSGYTITWDARGGFELGSVSGSYPEDFFERSDPVLLKCESSWAGSILYLYEHVRRNPGKRDEATIQVACLRGVGLVDATYSTRRWSQDNEKDHFPFDSQSNSARRCALDPLGLWYSP